MKDLSGVSHIQKDTENVDREQWQDNYPDHTYDDVLKVTCYVF